MPTDRQWKMVDANGKTTEAKISKHFSITAPPKTDIWRPSPTEDHFNAPMMYTSIKSSEFVKASVTISADWKTLYDQGGVVIYWPNATQNQSKWVKTGIEHFGGKPALSVVGNDRFSDWSLTPMPMAGATHATIEVQRIDQTLWVYFIFNGEKRALREIKWAFLENREADAEMWIGTYAAKPTPESDSDLKTGIEVIFRDWSLETTD